MANIHAAKITDVINHLMNQPKNHQLQYSSYNFLFKIKKKFSLMSSWVWNLLFQRKHSYSGGNHRHKKIFYIMERSAHDMRYVCVKKSEKEKSFAYIIIHLLDYNSALCLFFSLHTLFRSHKHKLYSQFYNNNINIKFTWKGKRKRWRRKFIGGWRVFLKFLKIHIENCFFRIVKIFDLRVKRLKSWEKIRG